MTPVTPTIPSSLTAIPNWLLWRLVQKPDEKKPRKVPFYLDGSPRKGAQGTPEDRQRLSSYDKVAAALAKGGYTGIGFAVLPGDNVVALDFDNCVENGVIEPRIASLVSGTYAEFSPSGKGIRAFMHGNIRSRKDNADSTDRNSDGSRKDGLFDIEFFGTNGFVTITGNATPDTELFGLEDTVLDLTPQVMALYRQRFSDEGALTVQSSAPMGDDDLLSLNSVLGWSLEEARAVLFDCDPNASRQQWLNALMAVHYELGGSPEALDLCDEWSSGGATYSGRSDVEGRWRSFGRGSGADFISGKWLLKWRKECVAHQRYHAVDERKKEISAAADEFTLREKICPQIARDTRLDEMGREAIAQALLESFKRLGSKYPIGQCRSLVAEPRAEKYQGPESTPTWLKDWVYVSDDDQFYRMNSDEWLSVQGFNARFNRELPVSEDGNIGKTAAWTALEDYRIPNVTRAVYLPWASALFEMEGITYVNSYRPCSVPAAADHMSREGENAVRIVKRHLSLLCGNRKPIVDTFIDWMAHNVQKPGVKIRWAPLVKGIEGDGKSVIGSLMSAVMGRVNVRNVSPKVLATDFTGWGEGSSLVVLEEIKLTGHNRYDILNALKPFITNDGVEIHRKGKDGYDAINTTNYLAFTNYSDALPLTDTDRRWMIIFTPFYENEGLAAAVGAGPWRDVLSDYFSALNEAIQQHRASLRYWLLNHPISADFKPNSPAPMTDEKSVMVGMGVSDEEMTVREILEKGAVGITPEVFLSSYLNAEVITLGADVNLATSAWSRLLGRIGYTRMQKKFKWRGKTEIVWVKGHQIWEPAKVRSWLAKTLPKGAEGGIEGEEGSESDDLF